MWQSHLSYHPRIGYTYTPNFKSRLPHESGGYLIRTNSSGFRSEREFVQARPSETFRALLFGDSQTAGLGVGNGQRFSDILEKSIPGLEVFNYGLNGTGTDQQYLAYLEFGDVEHDLLIIGLYVEDIRRVNSQHLAFADEKGREVFYGKPYYELKGGQLVLNNVPAPKRPWTRETLPSAPEPPASRFRHAQALFRRLLPSPGLRRLVKRLGILEFVEKAAAIQRAPDYDAADNPGWRLLRGILETWIAHSRTPVLLVPIPMWTFVEGSNDPSGYQARFRELAADTGCGLHDPLPDFLAYPAEERRGFRFQHDGHLTPKGHQALARSLAPVIRRIMGGGR